MPTVPRIERKIETILTPKIDLPDTGKIITTDLLSTTGKDLETKGLETKGLEKFKGITNFGELAKPGQPIMPDTEQVNRALNTAINIAKGEKERIDHAIATEMDLELYDTGTKLLEEIKQNYRGSNVAGAEDEFIQRWRDTAEGIRTKYVKNSELADAYNKAGSHYTKSFLGSVRSHTSKEFESYEVLQYKNKIGNRIDQAVKDPNRTQALNQEIKDEVYRFAKIRGYDEDWINNETREYVGAVHIGVINQLLENGNYIDANRYFVEYKKEIDADKTIQLGKIIKTQSDFQEGVDIANNIFNAYPNDALENNMKRLYKATEGKSKAFFETAKTELYGNHARRDDRIKEDKKMAEKEVYAHLLQSYDRNKGVLKLSDVPLRVWKNYSTADPEGAMKLELDLKRMADQGDKLTPEQKIQQTINWSRLASNQELLDQADLEGMVLRKQISDEQFKELIKQKTKYDPAKSESVKMVLQKINKFKFDTDKNKNLQEQVYHADLFMRYVNNNYDRPDYDPLGFWDGIAKVKEKDIAEKVLDFLSPGEPSVEAKRLMLEKKVGPMAKPTGPIKLTPSGKVETEKARFLKEPEIGKIYQDAKGRKARYLGNGKWEILK